MPKSSIRIATRASRLALWQSEHVRARLLRLHPGLDIELLPITTRGDKILDMPLAKVGGKGLFIKELEEALMDGRADLAVHSMKDVPTELPDGLCISVILEREDPRDALIAPGHTSLDTLPEGAVVGTSSLRRKSQILAVRPDLNIRDLRGNVPTRVEKLKAGDYDAIILATAGLKRLGYEAQICHRFATEMLLPAIGQGAVGVECRIEDDSTAALVAALDDPDTHTCVAAERAMNARLEGGCEVPIAGHAGLIGDDIEINGLVASVDGREVIRRGARGERSKAVAIGHDLGQLLLESGAAQILAQLRV